MQKEESVAGHIVVGPGRSSTRFNRDFVPYLRCWHIDQLESRSPHAHTPFCFLVVDEKIVIEKPDTLPHRAPDEKCAARDKIYRLRLCTKLPFVLLVQSNHVGGAMCPINGASNRPEEMRLIVV